MIAKNLQGDCHEEVPERCLERSSRRGHGPRSGRRQRPGGCDNWGRRYPGRTVNAPRAAAVAANEREVRAFLHDVINEHHGDQAGRFLTRDMQWHGGTVGTVRGRKDVAGLFAGVVASLPNAHASIKDIFGQGDQVVVRACTQKGALLGIAATGRNIHWDGVDIYRLQGGKISAIWAGDEPLQRDPVLPPAPTRRPGSPDPPAEPGQHHDRRH